MEINSKTTKAELEAYIKKLEAQLAENASLSTAKEETAAVAGATAAIENKTFMTPVVNVTVPTSDVTLVYLSNSEGYLKTISTELYMNSYGEEFTLSKSQFDEVAGKYRRWFERGILAVSHKNMDVAIAKGLPTDADTVLTRDKLNSIGTMSVGEIEDLWNASTLNQKHCIAAHVKRRFIEGDGHYANREKIDLFNRLTDGSFRREQDELSGRYTINPTEM